jgi:hypothetical protein
MLHVSCFMLLSVREANDLSERGSANTNVLHRKNYEVGSSVPSLALSLILWLVFFIVHANTEPSGGGSPISSADTYVRLMDGGLEVTFVRLCSCFE